MLSLSKQFSEIWTSERGTEKRIFYGFLLWCSSIFPLQCSQYKFYVPFFKYCTCFDDFFPQHNTEFNRTEKADASYHQFFAFFPKSNQNASQSTTSTALGFVYFSSPPSQHKSLFLRTGFFVCKFYLFFSPLVCSQWFVQIVSALRRAADILNFESLFLLPIDN